MVWSTADSATAAGGLPIGVGVEHTENQWILLGGFNASSGSYANLRIGDIFTIDACLAVNPMSGESIGTDKQFVVTAQPTHGTSTTGNSTPIYFYPEMIHTGPYKTVDTIPQLEAAVTMLGGQGGNYPQNLAFHKNAFALVMVPMEMPDSVWGARESEDGISIRVVKDYDINEDWETIRLDILYGVKTIYPELACRIYGATAS